ncbi:hypothetical protein PJL15_03044 [Paenarthrobacter nitroguajacolicus]|nr:hypothetical protein [Paenarthrobacter nitroguajacolicus]
MTRRAKLTPEQAGLPPGGGKRRVNGLRREEVAVLAGVSTEYYAQIERGDIARASEEILNAIASALQLDDVERQHLLDLCRAARPRPRQPAQEGKIHANVRQLMDAMPGLPASIQNGRLDLLATNSLGRALYADVYERHSGTSLPNLALYMFLDEHSHVTFPDWTIVAEDAVRTLQSELARVPRSKAFVELIGRLSTISPEFRSMWAAHNVSAHRRGKKRIMHPVVGELELNYEALQLPGAPGLQMVTFLPEVGSPAEDALRLLGSWNMPSSQGPRVSLEEDATVEDPGRPRE